MQTLYCKITLFFFVRTDVRLAVRALRPMRKAPTGVVCCRGLERFVR